MRTVWKNALCEELRFWEQYITTRGSKWPEDFQTRLDPKSKLTDQLIIDRLGAIPSRIIDILDVGAGPMTVLGKEHPRKTLKITAVDALAHEYHRLLTHAGINPPIQTLQCDGELLLDRFSPRTFDFVYARNSIDHTYDPLLVIRNMVELIRPRRWVLMRHNINVGQSVNYVGLHNWNFEQRNGDLILWSRTKEYNVNREFVDRASLSCRCYDGKWIACILTKAA